MIFKLTFKTPDVLDYALDGMSDKDQDDMREVAHKFIEYGECLTVEFDTTEQTARVVAVKR